MKVTTATPPIALFDGKHAFLSNFYASPVTYECVVYPTVEHAFQAAKALTPTERLPVLMAKTPGIAKRLGRKVALRPGWDAMRIDVMRQLLREKFRPECVLAEKLLATGDAELVEGNTWGDHFWGVCRGSGENWLGRLLMDIRTELAAAAKPSSRPSLNMLKKAWITPGDGNLCALTLESAEVTPEYRRLSVREAAHPANPTPHHPLRHYAESRTMPNGKPGRHGTGVKSSPIPPVYVFSCGIVRRASQVLEKVKQFIIRPITRSLNFDGCCFRQNLLFERQIGIEVDLGRLDRLMPQPNCDH